MKDLKKEIMHYSPYNEQEERDRDLILRWMETNNDFHKRLPDAHFTASAWILSADHRKILMCYHNVLR